MPRGGSEKVYPGLGRAATLGPALALALLLALVSPAAQAELVVLQDGRFLRAVSTSLDGDRVAVALRGGGTLSVDLDRVERIVDDEVDRSEPPVQLELPAAARSVRAASAKKPAVPAPFARIVEDAASRSRLDPALVAAVIRAESNFSPRAVSRKGARGLMQLMPATARRLGVTSPFDPAQNVRGGAAYLSELAERYGETKVELILAAYNAGEGAVEAYGGVPPFRETREYVRRVGRLWSGE